MVALPLCLLTPQKNYQKNCTAHSLVFLLFYACGLVVFEKFTPETGYMEGHTAEWSNFKTDTPMKESENGVDLFRHFVKGSVLWMQYVTTRPLERICNILFNMLCGSINYGIILLEVSVLLKYINISVLKRDFLFRVIIGLLYFALPCTQQINAIYLEYNTYRHLWRFQIAISDKMRVTACFWCAISSISPLAFGTDFVLSRSLKVHPPWHNLMWFYHTGCCSSMMSW